MSGRATGLIDKLRMDGVNVFTGTGNVTMVNEGIVHVNKASGAATTVTLPPHPQKGDFAFIKDAKGDAATNNITIQGASSATIDGATTYLIASNYGAAEFVYNGTEWNCVARYSSLNTNVQQVGGVAYSNTAASAAVTNTTTETLFNKNYAIPANSLKAGTVVKIKFLGIVTASNSTDTLTIKAYIGGLTGTALLTSSATDATNNDVFAGEITLVVRTTGASGTFVASGSFTKVEAASGTATRVDAITASTTIDTTAAQTVGVSATWSVANAGDSCRLDILTVEVY